MLPCCLCSLLLAATKRKPNKPYLTPAAAEAASSAQAKVDEAASATKAMAADAASEVKAAASEAQGALSASAPQ